MQDILFVLTRIVTALHGHGIACEAGAVESDENTDFQLEGKLAQVGRDAKRGEWIACVHIAPVSEPHGVCSILSVLWGPPHLRLGPVRGRVFWRWDVNGVTIVADETRVDMFQRDHKT